MSLRSSEPCLSSRIGIDGHVGTVPRLLKAIKVSACPRMPGPGALVTSVVRDAVGPPTFRFSGLRITVQDRPRRSLWLLRGVWRTPMDAGVCGCMRLEMRLLRPAGWSDILR